MVVTCNQLRIDEMVKQVVMKYASQQTESIWILIHKTVQLLTAQIGNNSTCPQLRLAQIQVLRIETIIGW